MYVRTVSGKSFQLFNNREIAKFLLFVAPKLSAAGDKIVGELPRLVWTDEVVRLSEIANIIKLRRERHKLHNPPPVFDDKIPF